MIKSFMSAVLVMSLVFSNISNCFAGGGHSRGYRPIGNEEEGLGSHRAIIPVESEAFSLKTLSDDLLKEVFSHLDSQTLLNANVVSHRFHLCFEKLVTISKPDFSIEKLSKPLLPVLHIKNSKMTTDTLQMLLMTPGISVLHMDSVEFIKNELGGKEEEVWFNGDNRIPKIKISNSNLDPITSDIEKIIKKGNAGTLLDLSTGNSMRVGNRVSILSDLRSCTWATGEKVEKGEGPIIIRWWFHPDDKTVNRDEINLVGSLDSTPKGYGYKVEMPVSKLEYFEARDRVMSSEGWAEYVCYKTMMPCAESICGLDFEKRTVKQILCLLPTVIMGFILIGAAITHLIIKLTD